MHVPVLLLMALAMPLALAISYWVANRPERHPDVAPGETELEFEARVRVNFGLSREYLPEFLHELQKRFENGWTQAQVEMVLVKVLDREADWAGRYLVTAAGTVDELTMRIRQSGRDRVLCCIEVPRAFEAIVRRVVRRYPVKAVG